MCVISFIFIYDVYMIKWNIMEFFRVIVFAELLTVIVGCLLRCILHRGGNDFPLILIPQMMGIVFVVMLFMRFVVTPLAEWVFYNK